MPTTLDQIVASARRRVASAKPLANRADLARRAAEHVPRGFASAVRRAAAGAPAVVAELKKASPSRGVIRGSFHVCDLAYQLASAGAAALSVLTDEEYFQGSLACLCEASAAVDLPCLRKDFIIDEFQLLESRANHADAVLLIVAALTATELRRLHAVAREFSLDVLCEVHDEDELGRALDLGCDIIGVNSRDLRTFQVDLNTALRLGRNIPPGVLKVAESGIGSGTDIRRLRDAGYEAFLIGESLMRAEFPGEALKQLLAEAKSVESKPQSPVISAQP
ncbi:MAG TPA: indole-3-glycerol phosphate synthase TrpC [Terriglobales bacterium]|nr:indole-3-glycerol phosphate synthase TrpC [Terriglobales bacterium]